MSSSTTVNSIPNPFIMMGDSTALFHNSANNVTTDNAATKQTTLSEKGVKVSVGGFGYLGRIGRRITQIWTQRTQL